MKEKIIEKANLALERALSAYKKMQKSEGKAKGRRALQCYSFRTEAVTLMNLLDPETDPEFERIYNALFDLPLNEITHIIPHKYAS